MPAPDQHIAAARRASQELRTAVAGLQEHYGDTIDMRRLALDTERIAPDIDLLSGPAGGSGEPPPLETIPDHDYPADFWADAEDEGLGRR